ncbi:hypothetical protein NDU88_000252 [Pleurodeles waltl]|uniref:Uncharacterized protein n=1 Tax=Pleurodeles waltl TaxID=8319 RepID=A0AAV7KX29_PLEWA|nr:hypothetical protein NDU88_000252 [Pleurodeles waltl]
MAPSRGGKVRLTGRLSRARLAQSARARWTEPPQPPLTRTGSGRSASLPGVPVHRMTLWRDKRRESLQQALHPLNYVVSDVGWLQSAPVLVGPGGAGGTDWADTRPQWYREIRRS